MEGGPSTPPRDLALQQGLQHSQPAQPCQCAMTSTGTCISFIAGRTALRTCAGPCGAEAGPCYQISSEHSNATDDRSPTGRRPSHPQDEGNAQAGKAHPQPIEESGPRPAVVMSGAGCVAGIARGPVQPCMLPSADQRLLWRDLCRRDQMPGSRRAQAIARDRRSGTRWGHPAQAAGSASGPAPAARTCHLPTAHDLLPPRQISQRLRNRTLASRSGRLRGAARSVLRGPIRPPTERSDDAGRS